jgi:AcrR family transcriptional regulator
MPVSTRDRLIKAAHELIYRHGAHAVGLDAILGEVGITKTAFYNHFSSKEDLMGEVLHRHDRWWQDTFRQLLRKHGGDAPRAQLLAIADVLREMFHNTDFNGCFFVNVAVQFPSPQDPAHLAAVQHKLAMEEIIREIAGYAGAQDPGALAKELSLIMEGAYVTQQVTRNAETAAIARRIATMVIQTHLPEPLAAP